VSLLSNKTAALKTPPPLWQEGLRRWLHVVGRAVDRLQIETLHPFVREGARRGDCPLRATGPKCVVWKPNVSLAFHEGVAFELAAEHLGKIGLIEMMPEPLGLVVNNPIAESDARIEILVKGPCHGPAAGHQQPGDPSRSARSWRNAFQNR